MTNDSVIDAHRSRPGLMLALLGAEAMRRLREAHTTHDLSPRQFEVLGLLHDRGTLGQSELGRLTGVAPSILVTLLNPLEAAHLVVRHRDPADRRRHVVALTDTGRERLHQASEAQYEVEDTLLAALTPAQRNQLRDLLTRVRDDLTEHRDHCATPASLEPRRGGEGPDAPAVP
ncbi:winged helix-turn-helix transcriptional regulator [Streptomyces sp. ISL-12]|uniref:MarR family winged helix-turn-helix transcriptional regulator n=1 Tax=Streptomyces sp. ISL-12 TaxID=2819177 RepID=UPI001BECCD78|nr:MarR family winged helix-turn-helix transcriptional regulator [Streptomyces sp. ISL-12]MBT2412781.1 winged helix-turn-helix transcriptional regulator [Streptomyces sp. ISL-12]